MPVNRLLVAVLLLCSGVLGPGSGPARAQGGPPGPPPPPPPDLGTPPALDGPARAVRWIDGFAAGAAEGRRQGRLLLVAVARERPPCPNCARLKARVFSKPEAAAISDRYVAVRLLAGDDATPETNDFMRRHGIEAFPTILAMTADGAVLTVIPTFSPEGRALELSDYLAAMEDAARKESEFQAQRKDLLARGDARSLAELARAFVERAQFAQAREVHQRILAADPSRDNYGMLAFLQSKEGDLAGERATLETMVRAFPQDAERIEWRIRLATLGIGTEAASAEGFSALVDRHVAALVALLRAVEAEGSLPDQVEVRMRIANSLAQKDDWAGMKENLLWVAEKDPTGRRAPAARLALAHAAYQREELETSLANLQALLDRYPDSPEAKKARDVLPQVQEELARKRGK